MGIVPNLSDYALNTLAIDPVNPSTLYVGGDGIAFKSTDGAASWAYAANGLPDIVFAMVSSFAINPQSPDTVYAAVGGDAAVGGAFKTTDGGAALNEAGLSYDYEALALDTANPDTV